MSPLRRSTLLCAIALLALCGNACSSAGSAHETITVTPAELERATATARSLAEAPIDLFSADRFTGSNGVTLPYRLLAPPEIRPGTRYPLVLSLHGSGEIGEDNTAQLTPFQRSWVQPEVRRQLPAYVLVPQFPARSASYADDPGDGLDSSHADPPLLAAMELVDALVERLPVDPRRVYVVGFSMGASAAWNALLLRPERFAAAVPIGGVPPERRLAPRLATANLLVVHGLADTENTPEGDRAMFVALRRAGARRVRLREYEGLGHRVPPEMLAGTEWRKWLFAQRR